MQTLLLFDLTIQYVQTEPEEDYLIESVILEEDLRFVVDDTVSCLPLSCMPVEHGTQSEKQPGGQKADRIGTNEDLQVF